MLGFHLTDDLKDGFGTPNGEPESQFIHKAKEVMLIGGITFTIIIVILVILLMTIFCIHFAHRGAYMEREIMRSH